MAHRLFAAFVFFGTLLFLTLYVSPCEAPRPRAIIARAS